MAPARKSPSFAKLFAELESIAAWFEHKTLDLEVGLEKFERGMVVAKELRKRLDDAEVRLQRIQAEASDGVSSEG